MRPMKPRQPGTLHAAVRSAAEQLGMARAADILDRSESWVHSAGDPDRDPDKAAHLTYAQARAWTREGATALAVDLASLAGGAFLPTIPETTPAAMHDAVARFSEQSGETVAVMVRSILDGVLTASEARHGMPAIDQTLHALLALKALVVEAANQT